MNFVAVSFAVCFVAAVSAGSDDYLARKQATVDYCKTEMNVGDDVAKIMEIKVSPENEQQKCFLECVYTKMGLVKDNKLSSEGSQKLAQRKYGNDPEKLKKAEELFTKCVGIVDAGSSSEKCYYGKAIRECFIKNKNDLLNVFNN